MILVTGSTSHFGQSAIRFLLKKGMPAADIAAFARNRERASVFSESGVNVIFGNYDDYDSEHSDMEMLLGRKPGDLRTILDKIYSKKEIAD